MKHRWLYFGGEGYGYEECERCGLRRRQRVVDFGHAVNRMRPRYRITEYAKRHGFWKWIKSREKIPRCSG